MSTNANPYATILGIATAIVSTMTWSETLGVVTQKIGETLFAQQAAINSYDSERRTITYESFWCLTGAIEEDLDYIGHVSFLDERPDFKGLIEDQQIVEVHVDDPGLSANEREIMKKWGLKTTLDGPLIYDGRTIGTVGVGETRFVRRFTPTKLISSLSCASSRSIGVHNAQQARIQAEEQRLAAVVSLAETLRWRTGPTPPVKRCLRRPGPPSRRRASTWAMPTPASPGRSCSGLPTTVSTPRRGRSWSATKVWRCDSWSRS